MKRISYDILLSIASSILTVTKLGCTQDVDPVLVPIMSGMARRIGMLNIWGTESIVRRTHAIIRSDQESNIHMMSM